MNCQKPQSGLPSRTGTGVAGNDEARSSLSKLNHEIDELFRATAVSVGHPFPVAELTKAKYLQSRAEMLDSPDLLHLLGWRQEWKKSVMSLLGTLKVEESL
jgi:hypothetical protein